MEATEIAEKVSSGEISARTVVEQHIEIINEIESDSGIEKYAREKLFMKKENEEIFLIEFDTLD